MRVHKKKQRKKEKAAMGRWVGGQDDDETKEATKETERVERGKHHRRN
jgi:hypothetical protein